MVGSTHLNLSDPQPTGMQPLLETCDHVPVFFVDMYFYGYAYMCMSPIDMFLTISEIWMRV